jgi:hyperosmotically inducible protein
LTAAIALALAASAACTRADTAREAREAAAEVRDVAARAGDRLADSWLTAKVQGKFFADDDIKARYIDVTTRDGRVTLKGFVESDAIRQQAVQIARNTEGVQQVEDRLLIGQAPATVGAAASGAVATTGSTAVTTPADSRPPDDSMVISLIQARYFVEPNIKMRNIDVAAANGVVTLRGQVASDHERAQALLLARTSHGVARVEDHLTVDAALGLPPAGASAEPAPLPSSPIAEAPAAAPSAPAPAPRDGPARPGPATAAPARDADAGVERSLKAKLGGDAQLKAAGLEVSARDGVVMLQGTVPNQAAKQRALTMARQTEGAVQVVDRITVKGR